MNFDKTLGDKIFVKREWGDWKIGSIDFDDIIELKWGRIAGGTRKIMPKSLIQAKVSCDRIKGEIGHSCMHGDGPHDILVCIVKSDNDPKIQKKLIEILGRQPSN